MTVLNKAGHRLKIKKFLKFMVMEAETSSAATGEEEVEIQKQKNLVFSLHVYFAFAYLRGQKSC